MVCRPCQKTRSWTAAMVLDAPVMEAAIKAVPEDALVDGRDGVGRVVGELHQSLHSACLHKKNQSTRFFDRMHVWLWELGRPLAVEEALRVGPVWG